VPQKKNKPFQPEKKKYQTESIRRMILTRYINKDKPYVESFQAIYQMGK
jgi:hypothetical protein